MLFFSWPKIKEYNWGEQKPPIGVISHHLEWVFGAHPLQSFCRFLATPKVRFLNKSREYKAQKGAVGEC